MSAVIQRQELHLLGKSDFLCPVHPLHHASNEQRRLLLVSVSAGNGHVRAAQAIAAHVLKTYAPDYAVRLFLSEVSVFRQAIF